ncbi:MAG: hypothetical protein V1722_00460 [Candidatus Micrarchaeota archaeon]
MLLDFATTIAPILDIVIVILVLILIYLLATRVFFTKWEPPVEEETETLQMMADEKQKQVNEMEKENQILIETIKRAKEKYTKRKITAVAYKKIVDEAQEKLIQNQAKLKFLK